jgi:hypothetical protein
MMKRVGRFGWVGMGRRVQCAGRTGRAGHAGVRREAGVLDGGWRLSTSGWHMPRGMGRTRRAGQVSPGAGPPMTPLLFCWVRR